MTHFEHLLKYVPNLCERRILDVGSGRDEFLREATKRSVYAAGIEINPEYIDIQEAAAAREGVTLALTQGSAERLPYPDESFDFANLSELIEHVEDPSAVLSEVARVLAPKGVAYISVPTRFSLRDPHFKLYGVNWVPRRFSEAYIQFFRSDKQNAENAGRQRLSDMHYYTFNQFKRLLASKGLMATDSREERLRTLVPWPLRPFALLGYYLVLRPFFFDTVHLFVRKQTP